MMVSGTANSAKQHVKWWCSGTDFLVIILWKWYMFRNGNTGLKMGSPSRDTYQICIHNGSTPPPPGGGCIVPLKNVLMAARSTFSDHWLVKMKHNWKITVSRNNSRINHEENDHQKKMLYPFDKTETCDTFGLQSLLKMIRRSTFWTLVIINHVKTRTAMWH